jgi:hypothetical protein
MFGGLHPRALGQPSGESLQAHQLWSRLDGGLDKPFTQMVLEYWLWEKQNGKRPFRRSR